MATSPKHAERSDDCSWPVREIALALRADERESAAIPVALGLARHFAANLVGLLLEDEALRRAALLPFTTEIRRQGEERRLDAPRLERYLREASEQLDAVLSAHARSSGLPVALRHLHGTRLHALSDAAGVADIVVFARTPLSRWATAGRQHPIRLERATGVDSARFDAATLALLPHTSPWPWVRMHWADDPTLPQRLRQRRPSLVLTSLDPAGEPESLQALIEALDCPIVVLRPK